MCKRSKIVLHICCAPCGTVSIERLLCDNCEVTLFFSNSNIYPKEEFDKRLSYVEKLAEFYKIDLVADVYDHEKWLSFVKGFENEPEKGERCSKCFEFNLANCAKKAADIGADAFSTTLTVSPHKNSKQIFKCGRLASVNADVLYALAKQGKDADVVGIPVFAEFDFKKNDGFLKSIEISKKLGLYRQNYCGCEFSLQSRW